MQLLSSLSEWWSNTGQMPSVVRILCQGAMVASPLLLLFLILPVADWTVDGQQMSYRELWSSGAGAAFGICLFLVMVGAWGLAARNSLSRWALVLAPLAPYAVLLIFGEASWLSKIDIRFGILSGIVTAVVLYACLFHLSGVRNYLSGGGDERMNGRGHS